MNSYTIDCPKCAEGRITFYHDAPMGRCISCKHTMRKDEAIQVQNLSSGPGMTEVQIMLAQLGELQEIKKTIKSFYAFYVTLFILGLLIGLVALAISLR